jgi:stage III sporulation protein AA
VPPLDTATISSASLEPVGRIPAAGSSLERRPSAVTASGLPVERFAARSTERSAFPAPASGRVLPAAHPPDKAELLDYLAPAIRRPVERLGGELWARAEELRLRQGRPLSLVTGIGDVWLSGQGLPSLDPVSAYIVSGDDTRKTLSLVSQGSVYALEEEFRNGFVTIPGGHRVGLSGRALLEAGRLRTITDVAGLSFRLSREVRGVARPVLPWLLSETGRPRSALIVSPPGAGKTTFLRDLVRLLSNGEPELGLRGLRVGLVDERSEVAACYEGVPQRDVGLRTDILDACPKAEGLLILLRAMSPEVVAADELGRPEDVSAVHEAAGAGVAVIATAHGNSLEDLARRPMLRHLLEGNLFEVFVVLSRRHGPGTIEAVVEGWGGRGRGL